MQHPAGPNYPSYPPSDSNDNSTIPGTLQALGLFACVCLQTKASFDFRSSLLVCAETKSTPSRNRVLLWLQRSDVTCTHQNRYQRRNVRRFLLLSPFLYLCDFNSSNNNNKATFSDRPLKYPRLLYREYVSASSVSVGKFKHFLRSSQMVP